MRPEVCIICKDVHHAQVVESEVRRIVFSLRKIMLAHSINTDNEAANEFCRRYRLQFLYDRQNPHFMCGHCYRAEGTMQLLRRTEDELKNLLEVIAYELYSSENIDKILLYKVLSLLRGYYPMSYKVMEIATHIKRKSEEKKKC